MTMVNKYVVSGKGWNLSFFYLFIQAVVSTATITACKQLGLIKSLAPFDNDRAKKCEYCRCPSRIIASLVQ
jgi:GDP-mannose transporter